MSERAHPWQEPRFPEGHVRLVFDDMRKRNFFHPAPSMRSLRYSNQQMRNAFLEGFDLPEDTFEKAESKNREAVWALMSATGKTQHGDYASDPTARHIAHSVSTGIHMLYVEYCVENGE